MDKFFTLPDADKIEAFDETGTRHSIASAIVEKDFWVCWTLKQIFENPQLAPHITFKGGTSLSKAYRLIDRFSEDIDLTISKDAPYLADGKDAMEDGVSGKERQRRIDALKDNARRFVVELALPILHQSIASKLPDGWKLELDTKDPDNQTILFTYPKLMSYGMGTGMGGYVQPIIRLEFGARGDIEPSENKHIASYVAELFPQLFDEPNSSVHVLTADRTFWEKVTILHALHHGKKMRERMSRHYYDTYILAQKGIADRAMPDVALLEQVVRNKSLMFSDNKASYDTAVIGQLRLMPKPEAMEDLKKDYVEMAAMFIQQAPDFETMMQGIADLEKLINS
ncbi:MAG: nucleotidyl transferase AbiEii/AbiGii toxin family protein [Rickettsiales bacterium]|jgi:predicted nucleotidyltransferase component of viral defense system|nr:nucleotidyl transferase AbiEii/AbiGii toxin family protein [Rickettsiales bacterium]